MRIDKNAIKNAILEFVIPVVALGLGAYASAMKKSAPESNTRYICNATYGDAVAAISQSDMFSSCKNEAIANVQKGANSDYYNAVIAIVNSDMFSSARVDAIENLK